MRHIASSSEQPGFVNNSFTENETDVLEEMDHKKDYWGSKSMVAAKEVATAGIRSKLREVQRVCEDGGETVFTTIVKVVELARKGVETKRKNVTSSIRLE